MGFDTFLKLEGIQGTDRAKPDTAYEGWIDLLAYFWGAVQPDSARFRGSDMAGSELQSAVRFKDITVVKRVDLSSLLICQALIQNQHIPTAEVKFNRTRPDGARFTYLHVELKGVRISEYQQRAPRGAEDLPEEEIRLDYEEMTLKYFSLSRTGPKGQMEISFKVGPQAS